jgi:hypothetical protein
MPSRSDALRHRRPPRPDLACDRGAGAAASQVAKWINETDQERALLENEPAAVPP